VVTLGGYLPTLLNGVVIIASLCALFYYLDSRKNFKGIYMYNHNEVKVFTTLETVLLIILIASAAVFVPLNLVVYLLLAGAFYSVANKHGE